MIRIPLLVLALSVTALAQERATLTTPVLPAEITGYSIAEVRIARYPNWLLEIVYQNNTGQVLKDTHMGVFEATGNPTGADVLVKSLNKANLSTQSLERRALQHLIDEKKIPASSITGTPQ